MTSCVAGLAVLALAGQARGQVRDSRELELRETIAEELVEVAEWCVEHKLYAEARPLLTEAIDMDPDNQQARSLAFQTMADSAADARDVQALEARLRRRYQRLATLYRRLFLQPPSWGQQVQFDAYLLRAYALNRPALEELVTQQWRKAVARKDWRRAVRLLEGAQRVARRPARTRALQEAGLKLAEADLAAEIERKAVEADLTRPVARERRKLELARKPGDPVAVLEKATMHDMRYYVSLPRGWSADKKWPILVAVDGSDCNWDLTVKWHENARGDRPFIIVVPLTFTNTNTLAKTAHKYPYPASVMAEADRDRMRFDETGLLAVLDDVRRKFGGADKFFITGHSGGGALAMWMALRHPDQLLAAAASSPNFGYNARVSTAAARETLPLMVFQGDQDKYLSFTERHWQYAQQVFQQHGFKIARTIVPGLGHDRCPTQVQAYFAGFLGKPTLATTE
jgi:poly(3-hydroxybutyrate) depolymerase